MKKITKAVKVAKKAVKKLTGWDALYAHKHWGADDVFIPKRVYVAYGVWEEVVCDLIEGFSFKDAADGLRQYKVSEKEVVALMMKYSKPEELVAAACAGF
jgi:hypothetical protein